MGNPMPWTASILGMVEIAFVKMMEGWFRRGCFNHSDSFPVSSRQLLLQEMVRGLRGRDLENWKKRVGHWVPQFLSHSQSQGYPVLRKQRCVCVYNKYIYMYTSIQYIMCMSIYVIYIYIYICIHIMDYVSCFFGPLLSKSRCRFSSRL